jgi:protein-S-isoprenylcysteine O-methyltransferase Ste14
MADDSRGPNIRIPPPTFFVLPMLTGFLVQHFVPIRIVSGIAATRTLRLVGIAEIVISLLLIVWAGMTLLRHGATPHPTHRAGALVREGPYTLTRNPMYLGMTVMYVGVVFIANSVWPLVFLPEAIALVYLFAIRAEEGYLSREFGEEYAWYRSRVRRWL